MIGKLKGIVDSIGDDWAVIDVGGVGYHVICSGRTLAQLPSIGEAAPLWIETYVREDAIRLYGFATPAEREWFRLLLSVQSVGTRVALAVLSTLALADLANAIAMQDKAMIAKAPGVGPKVAQRIVAELKDKASTMAFTDPELARLAGGAAAIEAPSAAATDAVSALVNLGYGQTQAGVAVAAALRQADDSPSAERLIRAALKELST